LSPVRLSIGESADVTVKARNPWNDSGIELSAGAHYDFIVSGNQTWSDASISCGADGYARRYLAMWEPFRRVPTADWFKLIGTIEQSTQNPIIIGSRLLDFSPSKSGRLYCFANDVRLMYWNNCGLITVTVTRK